jgi:transposase-like protein
MGRRRRARLWKAIEEVFQGTRHQRCWVHKTANVLNKVALSVQLNMKSDRLIDLVTQSPP